jgi:hypothetical protein
LCSRNFCAHIHFVIPAKAGTQSDFGDNYIHARNRRSGEARGWLAQGVPVEIAQLGPCFRRDDEMWISAPTKARLRAGAPALSAFHVSTARISTVPLAARAARNGNH